MIWTRGDGYEIESDPDRLDVGLVHEWLSTDAYWARGRSRQRVEQTVRASVNFAAYAPAGAQVAYARVVTDHAVVAWVCDVYVARPHRGNGLGTWLAIAIREYLEPFQIKRVMLSTDDAHDVYRRAGFVPLPEPGKLMVLGSAPNSTTYEEGVR